MAEDFYIFILNCKFIKTCSFYLIDNEYGKHHCTSIKISEQAVIAFLEALKIPFEKQEEQLPLYVLEGIIRGREDFQTGRTVTLDEFKKRRAIGKNI